MSKCSVTCFDVKFKSDASIVFQKFDTNKDGKLNYREFQNFIYAIGLGFLVSEKYFDPMMDAIDESQSGLVRLGSFLAYLEENLNHNYSSDQLSEALKVFDYTKKGLADVNDIKRVMKTYSTMSE
jgi:Ca2+-binding EF-hand superfamily protein